MGQCWRRCNGRQRPCLLPQTRSLRLQVYAALHMPSDTLSQPLWLLSITSLGSRIQSPVVVQGNAWLDSPQLCGGGLASQHPARLPTCAMQKLRILSSSGSWAGGQANSTA